MANIRVDFPATIVNGQSVTFRSPVDCSQITGLVVYYIENNVVVNRVFQFADAHGHNVGSVNLFAENVLVKVILDTDLNRAYVQNADTNAYIERTFVKSVNGAHPDENGNVTVAGSGQNGITPHIGANGNWWIGDTDTGVPASGSGSDIVVVNYNKTTGKLSKTGTAIMSDLDSRKIVYVFDNGALSQAVIVNKTSGERELYAVGTVLSSLINTKQPMVMMLKISADGYVSGYHQGLTMPVPSMTLVGAVPTVTETGISWKVPEGGSGGGGTVGSGDVLVTQIDLDAKTSSLDSDEITEAILSGKTALGVTSNGCFLITLVRLENDSLYCTGTLIEYDLLNARNVAKNILIAGKQAIHITGVDQLMVPMPGDNDIGKVLTVYEDYISWASPSGTGGTNGKDGVSATHEWNGTVLTVTSASGTSSADLKGEKGEKGDKGDKGDPGTNGENGQPGKDGTSITHYWSGSRLYITSASGTSSADLRGADGETGKNGQSIFYKKTSVSELEFPIADIEVNGEVRPKVGDLLIDCYGALFEISAVVDTHVQLRQTGVSLKGERGNKGDKGDPGNDGHTPVKGVDYYTEAEKEEFLNSGVLDAVETKFENEKGNMVQLLINELHGLPVFGVVDENNNITVTSLLPNGTYALKYEKDDGTTEEIGTITVGNGAVVYVNLLTTALAPDNKQTVFNGVGYKDGCYASAAEPFYNTDSATFCTGIMRVPINLVVYIKGITFDTENSHNRLGAFYENGSIYNTAKFSEIAQLGTLSKLGEQYYSITFSDNIVNGANVKWFYFSAMGSGKNCIVSETPIE